MQIATAIGDVQGCAHELEQLLAMHAPPYWLCGDLVNRGPASLNVLRCVKKLGAQAVTVLGNHDLHLLAVAYGVRSAHPTDTLDDILQAPDRIDLLEWLRHRPLVHVEAGHLLVHAGVLPSWTVAQTLDWAGQAQARLRGDRASEFLAEIFGTKTTPWREIINALTRLRFCTAEGVMDLKNAGKPETASAGYLPWFDVPGRLTQDTTVVFGHWSALGLVLRPNLVALDTGCVWGGQLSAVTLTSDPAQRVVTQVACQSC